MTSICLVATVLLTTLAGVAGYLLGYDNIKGREYWKGFDAGYKIGSKNVVD